jgi:predicted ATPase
MLRKTGKNDEAEQVIESSIAFARQQQSRSWELRSTMTLAGLLQERGRKNEARERLETIYNWFTEGHDTHDLLQARLLLDELNR